MWSRRSAIAVGGLVAVILIVGAGGVPGLRRGVAQSQPTPSDVAPPAPTHGPMSGHDGMGGHGHGAMSGHDQGAHHAGPTLPGQDAFGAIAEIVAILDADR